MVAFQPDALTISRGEEWREPPRASPRRCSAPAARWPSSASAFRASRRGGRGAGRRPAGEADGELGWEPWNAGVPARSPAGWSSATRAADDTDLSETLGEMMSEANGMPGEPSEQLPRLRAPRLGAYVARGEEGSLVGRVRRGARRRRDQARRARSRTGCSPPATPWRSTPCGRWRCSPPTPQQRERALADSDGAAYLEACLAGGDAALADDDDALPRDARRDRVGRRGGAGRDPGADRRTLSCIATASGTSTPTASRPRLDRRRGGRRLGRSTTSAAARRAVRARRWRCCWARSVAGDDPARPGGRARVSPTLDPAKPLPHMLDFFGLRFRLER